LSFHEYDQAIEKGRMAIEIDPQFADAQFAIAAAYDLSGRFDDALREYKKVLLLNPDDDFAVGNLGKTYVKKGDYNNAINVLEAFISIEKNSRNIWILNSLAWVSFLDQQFDKSIEYGKKVLEIKPRNRDARDWIQISQKGKSDRQKILKLINTILMDLKTSDDPIERTVAERLFAGQAEEVAAELQPKTSRDKKDGKSCFLYSLACFLLGDRKGASDYNARAIALGHQNQYLQEYYRLSLLYDLSLNPFIH
jgi:tetratricopeptide (TPR) repeat protein